MVKKVTTGLIFLMGISIIGIIIVQLIWMGNAVRLRNEQFDRGVSDAMHQTVSRLEKIHDVTVISHLAFPDSMANINIRRLPPPHPRISGKNSSLYIQKSRPVRTMRKITQGKVDIEVRSDSVKVIRYNMSADSGAVWMEKTDPSKVEKVIVLNGDTLNNYDVIFDRGMMALDSIKIVMDSAEISHGTINNRIRTRAQNLRTLAERAVTEIRVLDNPHLDRQELELILNEELNNRNIGIPYQYGIVRDSSLLMASAAPDTLSLLNAPYRSDLYPNNVFRRNIQLALFFPARDRYIFTSMGWLLGASLFFSMIILLAFAFSIFFLLRQKKISEMKADFINNMTHEFKTPIATISVASDSILDRKVIGDRGKVEYFASMIKKENQRMNRQVEDILTIARLEKKELEFKWDMVNLHEVIPEVCDVIRIQVEQREGTLNEKLLASIPLVRTDRQHISHVVFNLLDNANKYSSEKPDITIETRNTSDGILLIIADKGIGMSRQVQSRIFERFYRQPSGNVHNVKGFGLGLSYVKAIVEAHRGTVTVESEPGKGSTFSIFLPFNYHA